MYKQWYFYHLVWQYEDRFFDGIVIYFDEMFRDINSQDVWYTQEDGIELVEEL